MVFVRQQALPTLPPSLAATARLRKPYRVVLFVSMARLWSVTAAAVVVIFKNAMEIEIAMRQWHSGTSLKAGKNIHNGANRIETRNCAGCTSIKTRCIGVSSATAKRICVRLFRSPRQRLFSRADACNLQTTRILIRHHDFICLKVLPFGGWSGRRDFRNQRNDPDA